MAGNEEGALAIEFAMAAAKIEVLHPVLIALVGAESKILIDGRSAPCQSSFHLLPSQIVDIGAPTKGCRIYLAIFGISEKKTYDRQLAAGNTISAEPKTGQPGRFHSLPTEPSSLDAKLIRVIADHIPTQALTVSMKSNRVGIRLEGAEEKAGEEQFSEPSCLGAIQVTNDGGLIIHGPDGPTIGGYKKIGVVCSADIDKLGQLLPGDSVTLQAITKQEATKAWTERARNVDLTLRDASKPRTD